MQKPSYPLPALFLVYSYPNEKLPNAYATTLLRYTNDGRATLLCVGFLKDNKNLSHFIQIKI